nr:IclR family transcriptional regulator [Aneurinibacillus migulanus]
MDRREVVYIAWIAARGVSTVNVTISPRLPAHAIAIGKSLLAFQPKERLNEILFGTELQPYTAQTKTQILKLQQELNEIRERGYAVSNEEFESGIHSIAAPIFDRDGAAIAAVNIAAPVATFTEEFIKQTVIPAVRNVANEISVFSGYRFTNSINC